MGEKGKVKGKEGKRGERRDLANPKISAWRPLWPYPCCALWNPNGNFTCISHRQAIGSPWVYPWIYPWISTKKSVDMDGKFHIHGKPANFIQIQLETCSAFLKTVDLNNTKQKNNKMSSDT